MSAQEKEVLVDEDLALDGFEIDAETPKFCWRTFWSYTGALVRGLTRESGCAIMQWLCI